MENQSITRKQNDPVVTKQDLVEEKAIKLLGQKLGWMTHAPHDHSLFERMIHSFHSHKEKHDHEESYMDENPDFYTVGGLRVDCRQN